MGPLIVGGCYCLESLVASGIPDLKLDFLLVYVHISNLKINANSGHKVIGEGVILTK